MIKNRLWHAALLVGLCCLLSSISEGGQAGVPTHGDWGDQGDGSYANPVLPMDLSDLDAIRVGTEYYAISSTIQFSPGMVVLRSRDLVNWTAIGHVVPDLTRLATDRAHG